MRGTVTDITPDTTCVCLDNGAEVAAQRVAEGVSVAVGDEVEVEVDSGRATVVTPDERLPRTAAQRARPIGRKALTTEEPTHEGGEPMKPKTEFALRKAPGVLIGVAGAVVIAVELVAIIVRAAIGDIFPLLFSGGLIVALVLIALLMKGLGNLAGRNAARIAELEIETRFNSSGDEGDVA